MTIESKTKKEVLCIKLTGKLDTQTSPELEKFLDENVSGIKAFEFDFKKLDYISSYGLRVLLSLKKKTDEKEGYILIKHMNETVRAVFELTGFADLFIIK